MVPGDIVETRPCKKRKANNNNNNNSSSSSSSSSSSRTVTHMEERGEHELEYYVHYPGFDRRLDEWVALDRIDVPVLVPVPSAPTSGVLPAPTDGHYGDMKSHLHQRQGGGGRNQQQKKRKQHHDHGSDGEQKEHKEVGHIADGDDAHVEEITKVKNINAIVLGKYEIETWYYSPYPVEYCNEDRLYICEYCLKYMKRKKTLRSHLKECGGRRPPGKLIYRETDLAMYEIDGKDKKIYCQNLCLLSKLFLDHKTLYYDVDPFMYYVLCEVDSDGSHIVGYFSKEKQSEENYNLSCILTFPSYQRKGYGKFLISISYELSKREGTTGSPEKPLSDLGQIGYRSYWTFVLMKFFQNHSESLALTLNEIARLTGIEIGDILSTLESLSFIRLWRGQHVIQVSAKEIENFTRQAKFVRLCDPNSLEWNPPEKPSKKEKI